MCRLNDKQLYYGLTKSNETSPNILFPLESVMQRDAYRSPFNPFGPKRTDPVVKLILTVSFKALWLVVH